MKRSAALALTLLMLGCSTPMPPDCPASRHYTGEEQVQIAAERNIIADSRQQALYTAQGQRIVFVMLPTVLQEWEATRRALRACQ